MSICSYYCITICIIGTDIRFYTNIPITSLNLCTSLLIQYWWTCTRLTRRSLCTYPVAVWRIYAFWLLQQLFAFTLITIDIFMRITLSTNTIVLITNPSKMTVSITKASLRIQLINICILTYSTIPLTWLDCCIAQ